MPSTSSILGDLVEAFVRTEKIISRSDLDVWCGGKARTRLYRHIQAMNPEQWVRIANPEAVVRRKYEELLVGYKINN